MPSPAAPEPKGEQACEKCGSDDLRVRWHSGRGYGSGRCGWYTHNDRDGEHLHWFCNRCLYDWTERTRTRPPVSLTAKEGT